jgi:hypothetical protein
MAAISPEVAGIFWFQQNLLIRISSKATVA